MNKLFIDSLTCEYRENPLGTDVEKPRFSWQLHADRRGTLQLAYQIQIAGSDGDFKSPFWDTSKIISEQSVHIEYQGPALQSRTRYSYRVKIWDSFGMESSWSDTAWWETALLYHKEWEAQWITPNSQYMDPLESSAFHMRKRFSLKDNIHSARIYATSLGLYELHMNGHQVGQDLFTPGWTSYEHRLQYQTYDVTSQLLAGENVIGVILADGWYKGELAWEGKRHIFGDRRAALVQMHVMYQDGSEDIVITDSSWKCETGAIRNSEIYHGELYDARLEKIGWSSVSFADADWHPTEQIDYTKSILIAQENWATRVTQLVQPVAYILTPSGEHVLDFGQNMVGRVRMFINAPIGTEVQLSHAEVLDNAGNFYVGNLRRAKQVVTYITKGDGMEEYANHFSFQGFRYLKIVGYPGADQGLPLHQFIGEVIHSDMIEVGEFECSNELVNQLQRNIVWGQRGNFLDIPTDCPQRDERLGWTGDAQAFIRTATFNYHVGPFFTKWLRDLRADQRSDGGVPFVIPNVFDKETNLHSSSAWGDAAVICPWTMYVCYGDKRLLAEQYESMKAWADYIFNQGEHPFLWNTGFHFGDWLGLDAKENSYTGATPKELIATAFYAYSTDLVRKAAVTLGKLEDASIYTERLYRIRNQFASEFITPSGRLASPTQTAHALVLMFDLAEGQTRNRIARDLNQLIIENDMHLSTGFVGTPYLCTVLSENGFHETALKLLLQENYPSWLYPITKGATTIWEHWDGIKPDGTFWSDGMNSYNHYAYGAIGEWLYRKVAGLEWLESNPGYKKFMIQPRIGGEGLTHAKLSHTSMYGKIVSGWKVSQRGTEVEVMVPANTSATVILPGANLIHVRECGREIKLDEGMYSIHETSRGVELEIGSGHYVFQY
jgi:alpha-L-rhamnosidase